MSTKILFFFLFVPIYSISQDTTQIRLAIDNLMGSDYKQTKITSGYSEDKGFHFYKTKLDDELEITVCEYKTDKLLNNRKRMSKVKEDILFFTKAEYSAVNVIFDEENQVSYFILLDLGGNMYNLLTNIYDDKYFYEVVLMTIEEETYNHYKEKYKDLFKIH